MSRQPRVSVVIATYDYAQVLRFAIASVLAQDYDDFELLVIGDGCRDGSEQVVRGFADPRVRWFDLGRNSGFQSGPNNHGLAIGRGELVAYLSHDDLWLPHHLRCAVAAIDRGADLAYSTALRIVPGRRCRFAPLDAIKGELRLAASQVVHRREDGLNAGGWRFPRELSCAPGRDLWRRLLRDGATPAFTRRLSVLKFPARYRPALYQDKPCWEQQSWLGCIQRDPDIEITQLLHDGNRGGTPTAAWKRACEVAWREKRAGALRPLACAALRNTLRSSRTTPGPRTRPLRDELKRAGCRDELKSAGRRPGESYADAYERKRHLKGLPSAHSPP